MKTPLPQPEMSSRGHRNDTRSTFSQRLAVYFIGLAIGLVILGALQMGKRRALAPAAATTSPAGAVAPPSTAPAAPTPPASAPGR